MECLDGLRGVLAVYVLLGHLAPFATLPSWLIHPFSHGEAAVNVFFILSGMVIVQSLESFHWHAPSFLIARVARTYPVYLAMFALAVIALALPGDITGLSWLPPDSLARDIWSDGWPSAWPIEIATHLTMTHGLLPNGMVPGGWISFLGAAWSLSTEWQFYVLAMWLGVWTGPRRMAEAFLLLSAVGLLWQAFAPPQWVFSRAFLPNNAQFFALGIASAALARGDTPRRYALVLLATLATCAVERRGVKLLPPLVWTLCLAVQLHPEARLLAPLARVLRSRLLLSLGALSYCIYMVNEPVHRLLGLLLARIVAGDGALFTMLWLPGAVCLPLLLSMAMHRWIETPALRWGRARARSMAAAEPPPLPPPADPIREPTAAVRR